MEAPGGGGATGSRPWAIRPMAAAVVPAYHPAMTSPGDAPPFERLRREMIARQIAGRGLHNPQVLAAMAAVPREDFVPHALRAQAFDDRPLSIGAGQTISQPYMVAWMLDALDLRGDERVLEVGTGSGYAAAVLAELCAEVLTIERIPELARTAATRLRRHGRGNVQVRLGDGSLGWPEAAPFDAIVVAAGGPDVPPALQAQLAVGGRLVMPVGPPNRQRLLRLRRTADDRFTREDLGPVVFVPLVGAQGWRER